MKKIAIIGTGYVGLVSGTCFAEIGNDVICVDIDEQKVQLMKNGKIPIYEPGLEEIFTRNITEGRLHFTTNLEEAVAEAEVIFLALPTPPGDDGSADLSYILQVAENLSPLIKHYTVIIDKSTVPVGTAEKVRDIIAVNATAEFDVVSNPEFLREGFAVRDFMTPDRVVLGTESERAKAVMDELYGFVSNQDTPIIYMNERSAELTKYAANSFLATKITFMNHIANLCELVGADADAVRLGIGSDERIGPRFLYPGIGYGGSCFPKDAIALIHTAKEHGYEFHLLDSVITSNKEQQRVLIEKVRRHHNNELQGKTFALWGLSFKPDTDDTREAPAIKIIQELVAAGAMIRAYDPEAMESMQRRLGDMESVMYANDEHEALAGADALLIATEWRQFNAVSLEHMRTLLKEPVVFDGRNIFKLEAMRQAGFYYESIGRPKVDARRMD